LVSVLTQLLILKLVLTNTIESIGIESHFFVENTFLNTDLNTGLNKIDMLILSYTLVDFNFLVSTSIDCSPLLNHNCPS